MSFAIIISEKGGAERREVFDKNEIVVGRLQGNDLTLQKSNVSKKHVRLLFNAGRFIVADLESTNGTYVNGRKISKATIVREGDKIYVGDFVLRFEASPGTVLAPESSPSAPGPREATPAELSQLAPAPREAVSHYPLEHDPDEGSNPKISIPAPPRLPSGLGASPGAARGGTQAIQQPPPPVGPATDASRDIHAMAQAVVAPGAQLTTPHTIHHAPPSAPRPAPAAAPVPSPKPSTLGKENSGSGPRRLGLAVLLDALAERVDLTPLRAGVLPVEPLLAQRIEQGLRELAPRLRQEGLLPDGSDSALLLRDAQRELLGLGPLGQLLEEDDVHSLQLHRHDQLQIQRASGTSTTEAGFSSDEALRRTIARLCSYAHQPISEGELLVERRLPQGNLIASLPPLSPAGCTLTIRRRRIDSSPEDPVRSGVISRVAWNLLVQCLGARLGILLVAPSPQTSLLSALLAASPDERAAVLLPHDQSLHLAPQHTAFQLPASGSSKHIGASVQQMGFDRLAICALEDASMPALLEATERGVAPLAAARGSSLRHTLARLTASAADKGSLSLELARERLCASFDLAVEVGHLRDGRLRVIRVAEIVGVEASALATRDIFVTVSDRNGSGDSTLSPTGQVPRAIEDLRGRGFSVDPAIFERVSSR